MTFAENQNAIIEVLKSLREEAENYGTSALSRKVKYEDVRELARLMTNGAALKAEMKAALEKCEFEIRTQIRLDLELAAKRREERRPWNRFKKLFKI